MNSYLTSYDQFSICLSVYIESAITAFCGRHLEYHPEEDLTWFVERKVVVLVEGLVNPLPAAPVLGKI
jgi:hypothetical protein